MKPTPEQVQSCLSYGSEPIHFIADPMTIGRHEWTVIVFTHEIYGRCTLYLWRRLPEPCDFPIDFDHWNPQDKWPTYNGDHCDGGMPKSLAKLYARNLAEIESTLKGETREQVSANLF